MNLNEYEFNTEVLGEMNPETYEYQNSEQELVNELLNTNNEQEFENFLGNIWKSVVGLYNSPQGQALKRNFIAGAKQFGKKMVPLLGKTIGNKLGGKRGAQFGSQIGNTISGALFESESEAIDYIRVIRNAANYLSRALNEGISQPPSQIVTQAINVAARPYIRRPQLNTSYSSYQTQGQWIRKGNQIILLNV